MTCRLAEARCLRQAHAKRTTRLCRQSQSPMDATSDMRLGRDPAARALHPLCGWPASGRRMSVRLRLYGRFMAACVHFPSLGCHVTSSRTMRRPSHSWEIGVVPTDVTFSQLRGGRLAVGRSRSPACILQVWGATTAPRTCTARSAFCARAAVMVQTGKVRRDVRARHRGARGHAAGRAMRPRAGERQAAPRARQDRSG